MFTLFNTKIIEAQYFVSLGTTLLIAETIQNKDVNLK